MANNNYGWKISYAAYKKRFKKAKKAGILRSNATMISKEFYKTQVYTQLREGAEYKFYSREGKKIVVASTNVAQLVTESQSNIGLQEAKQYARDLKKFIRENKGTLPNYNRTMDFDRIVLDNAKNITYKQNPAGYIELTHSYVKKFVDKSGKVNVYTKYSTIYFYKSSIISLAEALQKLPKDEMYALMFDLGSITTDEIEAYEGY